MHDPPLMSPYCPLPIVHLTPSPSPAEPTHPPSQNPPLSTTPCPRDPDEQALPPSTIKPQAKPPAPPAAARTARAARGRSPAGPPAPPGRGRGGSCPRSARRGHGCATTGRSWWGCAGPWRGVWRMRRCCPGERCYGHCRWCWCWWARPR